MTNYSLTIEALKAQDDATRAHLEATRGQGEQNVPTIRPTYYWTHRPAAGI